MRKKDYELIASALHDGLCFAQGGKNLDKQYMNGKYDTWHMIMIRLCNELEYNNPKFNRSKFLQACGLEV